MTLRQRILGEVPRHNFNACAFRFVRKAMARDRARAGQLEQGAFKRAMAAQHSEQKRTRATANVVHAAMAAKLVGGGERRCHRSRERLDTRGKDPLLFFAKTSELGLPLAGAHGLIELLPGWVADPIEEAKHR